MPNHPGTELNDGRALAEELDARTITGRLWRHESGKVRCLACGHRCLVAEGRRGVCRVRFNRGGELRVPYGYVAGLQCDPVEKKPFYHLLPGSRALTFGMLGCDFHCAYCQNWVTSQALRDPAASVHLRDITANEIVGAARRQGARLVVSSYNEPLITAEWAAAVFQEARAAGLACAFVSNGNATAEVLDYLAPFLVAYKVDLKSFDDQKYRRLGGRLDHVLKTLRLVRDRGLWLEVVTLLVPGFNDREEELRQMARHLRSLSPDIPWHLTAFHPDYLMTVPGPTPASALLRAAEIGAEEGLRFVYAGNAAGRVGQREDTRCPQCHTTMVARRGFFAHIAGLTASGNCHECGAAIPGVWKLPINNIVCAPPP